MYLDAQDYSMGKHRDIVQVTSPALYSAIYWFHFAKQLCHLLVRAPQWRQAEKEK